MRHREGSGHIIIRNPVYKKGPGQSIPTPVQSSVSPVGGGLRLMLVEIDFSLQLKRLISRGSHVVSWYIHLKDSGRMEAKRRRTPFMVSYFLSLYSGFVLNPKGIYLSFKHWASIAFLWTYRIGHTCVCTWVVRIGFINRTYLYNRQLYKWLTTYLLTHFTHTNIPTFKDIDHHKVLNLPY